MLTQRRQTRVRFWQIADGILFAAALFIAYFLRSRAIHVWPSLNVLEPFRNYVRFAPFAAVLAPLMLSANGFYDTPRPTTRLTALFVLVRSCTFTVIGLILLMFVAREQLARSVIFLVGAIGGSFVYLRHEFTRWLDTRNLGQSRQRILWVGTLFENALLRSALTRTEKLAIEEVGEFDPATQPTAEFIRLLHEKSVNVVVLNLAGVEREQASRVLLACTREGVEVLVRPGLAALPAPHVTMDRFAGESVFYYRAQGAAPAQLLIKGIFDYVAAALLIIVCSPLFLLVGLLVRVTSKGPAVYRQTRAGLNGQAFTMYKFRSMAVNAELQQSELAQRNEMRGPVFKVTDDPRVTSLGRILRRHSLDELPQLWNVLRGEMSLVGPRPLPVEEVKRFDDDAHRRRLSVKPGLTCLWQISGRNDIADFTDWVRMDLAYIDSWSLWLDLKILVATIPVAILGRGGR